MAFTPVKSVINTYLGLHSSTKMMQPIQIGCGWQTLIAAGGVAVEDSVDITDDPVGDIDDTTHRLLNTEGIGTAVLLRVKYITEAVSESPIFQVFGRANSDDAWMLLQNFDESNDQVITCNATTDIGDGEYSYSAIDMNAHVYDLMGCTQVVASTTTDIEQSTDANELEAILQVKIL